MLNVNKKLSLKGGKFLRVLVVFLGIVDMTLQFFGRKLSIGVANTGVSFGWLSGNLSYFFNALGLFLVFFFYTRFIKDNNKRISIFLIIVGGGINFIQRLIFGNVWDYISLPLAPFTNNIADILITGGVIMYILGR